jgi:hypothetical protein
VSALPDGARICTRTGLVLLPARGEQGWRIAKTAYGPLNPPTRPDANDADPTGWGRFDTHGGRTVYAAGSPECAFAEVLAYHRRRLGQVDSLRKDAEFLGLDPAALAGRVEREWQDRGHLPPGHLTTGWRTERALYELRLPDPGWWVLLEHPDSLAGTEAARGDALASVGVGELDVSVLRGGNRGATVLIADWVHHAVLDDGSHAHGITYRSRHATGDAWAVWIRTAAGSHDPTRGPVRVLGSAPITSTDLDLLAVADRFGITIG